MEWTDMKQKTKMIYLILALVIVVLGGCAGSNGSTESLETGSVYIGTNESATSEIIEVTSNESWTIKNKHLDDNTYSITAISDTGEKLGGYPRFELIATEIHGKETAYAKREGAKYLVYEDEEGLYIIHVSKGVNSPEEIEKGFEEAEDPLVYFKEKAHYSFTKR